MLAVGGRFGAIAFHSLEDRPVKQFLAAKARGCVCPPELPVCVCGHEPEAELLTRRAVSPGPGRDRGQPALALGPPAGRAEDRRGDADGGDRLMAVAAPARKTAPAPAPSRTTPPRTPAPQKTAAPARKAPARKATPRTRRAARRGRGRRPARAPAPPRRPPARPRPAALRAAPSRRRAGRRRPAHPARRPHRGRGRAAARLRPGRADDPRPRLDRASSACSWSGSSPSTWSPSASPPPPARSTQQITALEQGELGPARPRRAARQHRPGRARRRRRSAWRCPSSDDIHFIEAGPDDVATAAQRLAAAGPG